jgi:hypothetical protein
LRDRPIRASASAWKAAAQTAARTVPGPEVLVLAQVKLAKAQEDRISAYLTGGSCVGLPEIFAYLEITEDAEGADQERERLGQIFATEPSEEPDLPDEQSGRIAAALWADLCGGVRLHVRQLRDENVFSADDLVYATSLRQGAPAQSAFSSAIAGRWALSPRAGRAWLLAQTGTSERGERLFGFTHRTFLEYFSACFIVRHCDSAQDLVGMIRPMIRFNTSEVVPQIAIQQFGARRADGIDDCLEPLVPDHSRRAHLDFALRCLRFMRPTPRVLAGLCRRRLVGTGQYVATLGPRALVSVAASIHDEEKPGTLVDRLRMFFAAGEQDPELYEMLACLAEVPEAVVPPAWPGWP